MQKNLAVFVIVFFYVQKRHQKLLVSQTHTCCGNLEEFFLPPVVHWRGIYHSHREMAFKNLLNFHWALPFIFQQIKRLCIMRTYHSPHPLGFFLFSVCFVRSCCPHFQSSAFVCAGVCATQYSFCHESWLVRGLSVSPIKKNRIPKQVNTIRMAG